MKSGLELHDSRVSQIEVLDGVATIYFSHAYIHKSKGTSSKNRGTGWSQEAQLVLSGVHALGRSPSLPNTISEGFLEIGGIRHEVIPLPFKRKVSAKLYLLFADGTDIEFIGEKPFIELGGPDLLSLQAALEGPAPAPNLRWPASMAVCAAARTSVGNERNLDSMS